MKPASGTAAAAIRVSAPRGLAELLQRPDIWCGDASPQAPVPAVASGFAELDALLPGGGWPRGQLVELLPAASGIGELSLLLPCLAALSAAGGGETAGAAGWTTSKVAGRATCDRTGEGGAVLLLSTSGLTIPHAPAWAAAGVHLPALRVVAPAKPRDALWAAVRLLRCREIAATLLWLEAERPWLEPAALRRLHAAAGQGGGLAFLFRPPVARRLASPAPLRLALGRDADGLAVELFKRRGAPPAPCVRPALAHPLDHRRVPALAGPRSTGRRSLARLA